MFIVKKVSQEDGVKTKKIARPPPELPVLDYRQLKEATLIRRRRARAQLQQSSSTSQCRQCSIDDAEPPRFLVFSQSAADFHLPIVSSPTSTLIKHRKMLVDPKTWRKFLDWDPCSSTPATLVEDKPRTDFQPAEASVIGPADSSRFETPLTPPISSSQDEVNPTVGPIERLEVAHKVEDFPRKMCQSLVSLEVVVGQMIALPMPMLSSIVSFLSGDHLWTTLMTISLIGQRSEKKKSLEYSLSNIIGSLEDTESLWPRLLNEWTLFVCNHRRLREAAIEMGDMNIDMECSTWPECMGDVEHDPPVWIRDPSGDLGWLQEREAHDSSLRDNHQILLANLIDQVDTWSSCCINQIEYFHRGRNISVVLAPLVVFGGGPTAVRMYLEMCSNAFKLSKHYDATVQLSLSGCGGLLDARLLRETLVGEGLAPFITQLDMRGLSIEVEPSLSGEDIEENREALSSKSLFEDRVNANRTEAAEAKVTEAGALDVLESVGIHCCKIVLLDVSSITFTLKGGSDWGQGGGFKRPSPRWGLNDMALAALAVCLAKHGTVKKLAIGSASGVTDAGLRALGK